MRAAAAQALTQCCTRPDFVFLTGDLGFMALEPLREAAGSRFINAGVAEQNMVSVAAGLARGGLRPFVYSIAPFVYARPLEQIRNDVCHHHLSVCLIGNGGGYGYGVMGSTHHALEDYGILLTLLDMTVHVPAFAADVPEILGRILHAARPAYLRLGRDEKPPDLALPAYAPWRKLVRGLGATMVIVGPLAGPILREVAQLPLGLRPNVWVLSELPLTAATLPHELLADLAGSGHLFVLEEHVEHGGAGAMLAHALLSLGKAPKRFTHRHARGYPSGRYGSQGFHRKESGLDAESVVRDLRGGA